VRGTVRVRQRRKVTGFNSLFLWVKKMKREIITCDFYSERSENRSSKIAVTLCDDGNICIYCEHDETALTFSIKNAINLRDELFEVIDEAVSELITLNRS